MSGFLHNLDLYKQGGQSHLYKTMLDGIHIAVKTPIQGRPSSLKAFRKELTIIQNIPPHPNVQTPMQVGENADLEFYTALWVEQSLSDYVGCAEQIRDAIPQILLGICEGIKHIHNQGVLHLDVKPANILLADDFRPVIIDFGLSRLLGSPPDQLSNVPEGTYQYMAPELWNLGRASAATDIYSLGLTVLHLLTGKLPFMTSSIESVKQGHLNIQHPLIPQNTEWHRLNYWLSKTVAPNPAQRFFNMNDTIDELCVGLDLS